MSKPSPFLPRLAAGVVLAAAITGLAACEERLSDENYDKIAVGMSMQEVERVLGAGEQQTAGGYGVGSAGLVGGSSSAGSSQQTYLWKSGGKQVVLTFQAGKVAAKTKTGF